MGLLYLYGIILEHSGTQYYTTLALPAGFENKIAVPRRYPRRRCPAHHWVRKHGLRVIVIQDVEEVIKQEFS